MQLSLRNLREFRPPFRILFLIDELETWGGAERHLFELTRALDRSQFLPTVAVLHGARQAGRFRAAGIEVIELAVTRIYDASGAQAAMRLRNHIVATDTALLVTYHTAADLLGPLVALSAGIPTISSRRDMGFTKKPSHVQAQRHLNRSVGAIIAVAESVRRAVIETEGYPASRIHVIYNGVDTGRYAPRPSPLREELGIGHEEILIGTLANFDPVKGYDVLAPAVEKLLARVPARLVMFGEGPLLETFRKRLAPLHPRVLLPGARKDVEHVLWALDIFVLASHSEGLSNAILEAMAAGRAICATRVGGNPELLDASTGVLVPPGDPDALADALEALCRDPACRASLGKAARQRATQRFSFEGMVRRYEETFHIAIEERSVPPLRRVAKSAVAHSWRALAPLIRVARGPGWACLCYHRVVTELGGWNLDMVVTADTLREQLRALRDEYECVTCRELGRALMAGSRRRLLAVSFDDGYADNLEVGLPILREVGIPATVFVATDAVEHGVPPWYERVAAVLGTHIRSPELGRLLREHRALRPLVGILETPRTPRAAVREAIALLKKLPTKEREQACDTLVSLLGPPGPESTPRFLSVPELHRLEGAGVEIGGHTRTHPILPLTDEVQAREEIVSDRERLGTLLGHPVESFAYPNGDADPLSLVLVREAGYAYGFTVGSGPWDGDRHTIPRRVASEISSLGPVTSFSRASFLAFVEGVFDYSWRRLSTAAKKPSVPCL